MSLGRRLLRMILVVILTPVLFLLAFQSRLIYYPNPYREEYRADLARHHGVRLEFKTSQGAQTAFYVLPANKTNAQPEAIWLCCAGNGSLALDWLSQIDEWNPRFGYLLVDYPGYGDCKGGPTPSTIHENTGAAVTALATHLGMDSADLKPRLSGLGHSLGCAAVLMAADDLDMKRIVLIAPFTTMTEMGRRVLGWPLCYLNLHRFDNRRHLASVVKKGASVRIFHGLNDDNVPATMSRELAAASPGSVTLAEVRGAGHNDIVGIAAREIGEAMMK